MANEKSYITLTDENFQREVIESNEPVLVDFWAAWCGPCLVLGPIVEELAGDLAGQAKVGKLNVDENPGIASEYGIRSIPTVLIFDKGKVADSAIGVVPKKALREKINSLVAVA
jgi:thioredoxin 1